MEVIIRITCIQKLVNYYIDYELPYPLFGNIWPLKLKKIFGVTLQCYCGMMESKHGFMYWQTIGSIYGKMNL